MTPSILNWNTRSRMRIVLAWDEAHHENRETTSDQKTGISTFQYNLHNKKNVLAGGKETHKAVKTFFCCGSFQSIIVVLYGRSWFLNAERWKLHSHLPVDCKQLMLTWTAELLSENQERSISRETWNINFLCYGKHPLSIYQFLYLHEFSVDGKMMTSDLVCYTVNQSFRNRYKGENQSVLLPHSHVVNHAHLNQWGMRNSQWNCRVAAIPP